MRGIFVYDIVEHRTPVISSDKNFNFKNMWWITTSALQVDRIWPEFILFSHGRRYILVTRCHRVFISI